MASLVAVAPLSGQTGQPVCGASSRGRQQLTEALFVLAGTARNLARFTRIE